MLYPSLPTLCFYIVLMACIIASGGVNLNRYKVLNVAYATSPSTNMLAEHAITASISRKLAFPDFRDDEKAGAITLLGSAEIDKNSGTINIPATSKSNLSNTHNMSMSMLVGSSPQFKYQPAPSNWSHMAGRALYSFPFRMMDPVSNSTASFHTTFSFRMRKGTEMDGNTSALKPNSSDGGLTFLVVPDELTVGRNGGWLGMMNDACDEDYKPFAVEFDTFKNEEFQDPNDHHVGINYGSIVSHQTADIADAGISLRDGTAARAWISYDSSKHVVDVRLAKDGNMKPVKPLIAVPLDLSNIFKEYMFVGFSGGASDSLGHSILSWHFSSDSTGLLRLPKQESCVTRLLPQLRSTPSKKAPSAFIIFCLVILIIGLAVLNFVCIPYKKKGDEGPNAVKVMRLSREKPRALYKPKKLSLSEILEASRLFNEGEILGSGKGGVYYRGVLQDSSQVAIKRFSSSYLRQAAQGSDRRRIEKEISRLIQVHHPNIVPLRGWCIEKEEVLLVYEYMPNGSLDDWLFSQASTLPWTRRYKIVKELAGALAFLHSSSEKPIVHKNVKLSNVLLDITFRAKLGDFGLFNRVSHINFVDNTTSTKPGCKTRGASSRRTSPASTCVNGCLHLPWNQGIRENHVKSSDLHVNGNGTDTIRLEIVGSPISRETSTNCLFKGCLPQAILMSDTSKREANDVRSIPEEADDVYNYGVMLCEIVSGRMEGLEEGEVDLVEWVWSLQEEGKLEETIDEDLRFGVSRYYSWKEEAISVLNIGLLCTHSDLSQRPNSMEMVIKYLNGEIPLSKIPPRRSSSSTIGAPYMSGGSQPQL